MQVYCQHCDKEFDSRGDGVEHWPNGADTPCSREEWWKEALKPSTDNRADYLNKIARENRSHTTKRSDHPQWGKV